MIRPSRVFSMVDEISPCSSSVSADACPHPRQLGTSSQARTRPCSPNIQSTSSSPTPSTSGSAGCDANSSRCGGRSKAGRARSPTVPGQRQRGRGAFRTSPLGSCVAQAVPDSLLDKGSPELSHGADDLEHQTPRMVLRSVGTRASSQPMLKTGTQTAGIKYDRRAHYHSRRAG